MKLLLCKNVDHLGIVGDVVDVSAGYARNYLLPQHIATEPTEANTRKLAEARRIAEEEIAHKRKQLEALAAQLNDVEVTIRARANEDGVLYGSVGRREITDALAEEGYIIKPDHVALTEPIRRLDNVVVELHLAPEISAAVKVWVVREKPVEESDDDEAPSEAGMEAGSHDHNNDE